MQISGWKQGVVLVVLLFTQGTLCAQVELLVPAYFYPSGTGLTAWNNLTTAQSSVAVTAILNPNSGPGLNADPNYIAAVNSLRGAGGKVIGYVPTGYTARTTASVLSDVATFASFYNLDGIFLDEMTNDTTTPHLNYYSSVYSSIKASHPSWRIFGNPGTQTDQLYFSYASGKSADTLVVFENTGASYPGYVPSAWNASYPRSNFAHLVHTEPSAVAMQADIPLASARNAGYLYITDDVLANPWDTLPGYWNSEVTALASFNASVPEPRALAVLGAGLFVFGATWRQWKQRRAC